MLLMKRVYQVYIEIVVHYGLFSQYNKLASNSIKGEQRVIIAL